MKIDIGEGSRETGAPSSPEDHSQIHGGVGSVARSDTLFPDSNRAVVREQHLPVSACAGGLAEEGMRALNGVVGTRLSTGISGGGGGGLTLVQLSVQQRGGSSRSVGDNSSAIVGSEKFYQEGSTTATAGCVPLHLRSSTNLGPPEENGSPGSGTPPTATGGDPCPSCTSSHAHAHAHAQSISSAKTITAGVAVGVNPSVDCRCGDSGDKAQGGHTGGNPVAAADAVAVEPATVGGSGRGYHALEQPSAMVATESGGGGRQGDAPAAMVVGLATTTTLQQYVDPRHPSLVGAPNQQPVVGGTTGMMVAGVRHPMLCALGEGVGTLGKEFEPGGGRPWSGFPQLKDPALVAPRQSTPPVFTGVLEAEAEGLQQQQQQDVEALQADTMDRLAQSLAQAQQLALSVEARQTELLARPKRRCHPSAKQESATQSRKVRPKSMSQQGGKLPKLEDLGVKVEPAGAMAAAAPADSTAAAANTAVSPAPAPAAGAPADMLMPKQRLLIKIPRAAVTAATAHAAEVAAAAAAKRENGGDTKPTKRGKGKSGVKRARPLAGSRASLPPPPPPAPTSRQEPPPGCGPPSPSLARIFGREIDMAELETAHDGAEHLVTSQASRRLSALSMASPSELASHVQSLRLDYLVQKVRPILTKLMSSGTGPQRGLFNVPVDPLKLGIPDYFKRVPHPMDLGTIKSRLLSLSYTTPEAFAADVRLVFRNAIGFNPESHFVHTWAVQLLNEFDQEYSKQIGKLDEGWAKSLNHSCQLCQGQTCVLCGDKCLKLEPPVIICHHCNKRVVRGGVYHITRDGCRLWCSRCHPGLPPELPTDGDPEGLVGDETVEGSSVGSTGCGDVGGAGEGGATSGGTADGETPATSEGGVKVASAAMAAECVPSPTSQSGAPPPGSGVLPPPAPSTAFTVPEGGPSFGGNDGCGAIREGSGGAAGGGARETRAVSEAGSANGGTEAPGSVAASEPGGSVGGAAGGGAAASAEETKAPLKRDLLRRKFDEEISEPWVQCDRCNSWVHQVCALFNSRANVGEARFVCPLCRLRSVVMAKKPCPGPAETAAEGDGDASIPRKRPKSVDGNGQLLPNWPVNPDEEETSSGGAGAPIATHPGVPGSPAAPAPAGTRTSPPPSTAESEEAAPPVVDASLAETPGGETAAALRAGGVSPAEEGPEPKSTASIATSAATTTAAAALGVAATADASAAPGDVMPPLERSPRPPVCSPNLSEAKPTGETPSPSYPPVAVVSVANGVSRAPEAATSVVADPSGLGGAAVETKRIGNRPSFRVVQNCGCGETEATATTVEAGKGCCEGVGEAEGAAVAAAAAAPKDPMEVDEDLGAEAAGDKTSGSAASDNVDVYAASSLPHSPLSRYIEQRVRQRLAKLESEAAAATLSIRLISNVEATCEVHPVLRETFCCKDGHGVGPHKNDVPELLKYRSKALSMFQRVDGVEVCLFSMYVQEYGADAPYFNARRAYISYLDSVEYFRPRQHRTAVYHEILVAYLDWLRRRGFKAAHIWSCPPQRGNNFIFWCHPLHQKTPTRDRLTGWYGNMLKRAVQLGVAAKVTTLDKTHFTEVERIGILLKNRRTSAAASAAASLAGVKGPDDLPLRPEIPVIFEGDFWAEEAVRLARAVERRDDGQEDTQTPLELCRQALEELIRHQQGAPFAAPVDPARDRCPDYLAVIERPMDLGTVAETLDAMKYHDAGAFVSDVRLVFDNARKYNPPKHPIHIAATKLAKVFDKTVRALENAVNRLPGMHEMGLEHLLLEEPALPLPPAPATPTPAPPTPGGGPSVPAIPPRPTAPGKRSIPWAFDAIGPLSALARKTWAANSARTARAVGTLPPMSESSPVEVGMPPTMPAWGAPSSGAMGGGGSADGVDAPHSSAGMERLSRSGSTSVMSVSEFYGPSGARMLQRRSSTASQLSLADSYGEGEVMEHASEATESREGQAALSSLMAAGAESEHPQCPQQQHVASSRGGVVQAQPPATALQPSPSPAGVPPSAWCTVPMPPGQQQTCGAAPVAPAGGGEDAPNGVPSALGPLQARTLYAAGVPQTGTAAPTGCAAPCAYPAEAAGAATLSVPPAGAPQQSPRQAIPGPETTAAAGLAPISALPETPVGGVTRDTASPSPLTLDAPHPSANGVCSSGCDPATAAAAAAATTPTPAPQVRPDVAPPSLLSLPWVTAPGAVPQPLAEEPLPENQHHQRVGLRRAMSVDSASSPGRPHARTPSLAGVGSEVLGGAGEVGPTPGSESFGITVNVPGGSGICAGRSASGGSGGYGCGVSMPSSPRLRAQSMDSGGRKGKTKRGKGPGAAVTGKADRIGRMLQSLSRAVTRISKDLLVVTLGSPDQPATPPAARAGPGMTKETMLAELEAWHASSGLEGVLTPDCHDPDPPISRALVDARHTFLEMCQFRHYQFDTLRRAKHSSAMVLYHLHRPESRSLNPFCSRCRRPVRFVRYHCGVCNYDLCAECDEEVDTKCEDGHPLTPYRVTFSTEDAEESPAPGRTPATGGTNLSPRRSPVRERGGGGSVRPNSPVVGSSAPAAAGVTPATPSVLPADTGGEEALNHLVSPPMRDLRAEADGDVGHADTAVAAGSGSDAAAAAVVVVAPVEEGVPEHGHLAKNFEGREMATAEVHAAGPLVDVGGGEVQDRPPAAASPAPDISS